MLVRQSYAASGTQFDDLVAAVSPRFYSQGAFVTTGLASPLGTEIRPLCTPYSVFPRFATAVPPVPLVLPTPDLFFAASLTCVMCVFGGLLVGVPPPLASCLQEGERPTPKARDVASERRRGRKDEGRTGWRGRRCVTARAG